MGKKGERPLSRSAPKLHAKIVEGMEAALTETAQEPRRRSLGSLESLTSRPRITGAQAAARSKLVRRLRIVLPLLAVALIVVLMTTTRERGAEDVFLDEFANLDARPEELRMANPTFAGVDNSGRPFEVTAEAALQAPNAQEVVELVRPRAITKGVDADTRVTAARGVFQSEKNELELSDGVTLEHAIGGEIYTLRTPAAKVALEEETVQSTSGVEGDSAAGTLKADRMQAYNSEGRVVFEGNVSMRIYPSKAKQAKASTSDPDQREEPDQ